ncbi:MAG: MFS transporter [Thermoanaerobaculia bacterium]
MRGRDFVKRLGALAATVFVDMLGLFIVLPLLPNYAERVGSEAATTVGALVSTFAFAALTTAPIWGKLSDRYGRRPMILGGLTLAAVAFVLMEHATVLWVLFLSRLFQGAGSGTTGVVQAYLSDSVDPEHRAQALGWITAATSAGVALGGAVGSLAVAVDIPPGYLAASLCVLNLLFAWRWLPEPVRDPEPPGEVVDRSTLKVFLEVVRHPTGSIGALVWIYTAGMMALMAMSGMLSLYLQRSFGLSGSQVGWAYFYVGSISMVVRALLLGAVVRRLGEVRTLRTGLALMVVGLTLLPLAPTVWAFALPVALMPIGTAFLFPATTSLVAGRGGRGRTGTVLGVQQAIGGVARMLGPLLAGLAFQHLGSGSPFWLAAGLIAVTLLFSSVVRDDEKAPVAAAVIPTEPS